MGHSLEYLTTSKEFELLKTVKANQMFILRDTRWVWSYRYSPGAEINTKSNWKKKKTSFLEKPLATSETLCPSPSLPGLLGSGTLLVRSPWVKHSVSRRPIYTSSWNSTCYMTCKMLPSSLKWAKAPVRRCAQAKREMSPIHSSLHAKTS